MGEGINGVIIGKCLTTFDDYYASTNTVDLDELKNKVEGIRKEMGFEDVPIKIYCGTKCC